MIVSAQHTLTTTASQILAAAPGYRTAHFHVVGNGITYVGAAGVTSSTGMYLDKNSGVVLISVPPGDSLYAVAASGTETITVLVTGP